MITFMVVTSSASIDMVIDNNKIGQFVELMETSSSCVIIQLEELLVLINKKCLDLVIVVSGKQLFLSKGII